MKLLNYLLQYFCKHKTVTSITAINESELIPYSVACISIVKKCKKCGKVFSKEIY